MTISLTPDQKAFIRQAIEAGRFASEEDALREALSLWEGRERARFELLAALDDAEADLEAGRIITAQSMDALAEEIKQQGRARLAAETGSSS